MTTRRDVVFQQIEFGLVYTLFLCGVVPKPDVKPDSPNNTQNAKGRECLPPAEKLE